MKKFGEDIKYVVETKIDGLSVALEYKEGEFARGATRGNGQIGEDVTAQVRTIKSVPLTIPFKDKFVISFSANGFSLTEITALQP